MPAPRSSGVGGGRGRTSAGESGRVGVGWAGVSSLEVARRGAVGGGLPRDLMWSADTACSAVAPTDPVRIDALEQHRDLIGIDLDVVDAGVRNDAAERASVEPLIGASVPTPLGDANQVGLATLADPG